MNPDAKDTFDSVMAQIRHGLTGNPQRDIAYLVGPAEAQGGQPFSQVGARGEDYTHMDGSTACDVPQANGQPISADVGTLNALAELVSVLRDDGQRQKAAWVAGDA